MKDNAENGLLSRFLLFQTFKINRMKNLDDNELDDLMKEKLQQNKDIIFKMWQECTALNKKYFLDISKELKDEIFEKYEQFESELLYIYKFKSDIVMRMPVIHKRIILVLSAIAHFQKFMKFDLDYLNEFPPEGWTHKDKIPVDTDAVYVADIIMKNVRETYVKMMFGVEKQKYRDMPISVRNDTIIQMRLKGFSDVYLADLFGIPLAQIKAQMLDRRNKTDEDTKNRILEYCSTHPHKKDREEIGKVVGVSIRTIYNWCKAAGITGDEKDEKTNEI